MATRRRGEETRARLLDAALRVFDAEGRDGFTIQAVLRESGASIGSFYHHFGGIDGLAAALYERSLGELLDALGDALDAAPTARAGIAALVRTYLAYTAENPAAARFIHDAPSGGYLQAHGAALEAAKRPRLERLLCWLRGHVRAGRIVELPESLHEMLVIGPVAEVARRWLAGAPGIDLGQAARLLPERIWHSVRRPSLRDPARRAPRRRAARRTFAR